MLNWFKYKAPPEKEPAEIEFKDVQGELVHLENKDGQLVVGKIVEKTKLTEIEKLEIENQLLKNELEKYRNSRPKHTHDKEHYILTKPKRDGEASPDENKTTTPSAPQLEIQNEMERTTPSAPVQSQKEQAFEEGYTFLDAMHEQESFTRGIPIEEQQDLKESKFKLSQTINDNETQTTCVLDLKSGEWWTVVPSKDNLDHVEDRGVLVPCEDDDMDDSYVLVQEGDLTDAISEFISKTLQRYPEYKRLNQSQMKRMLDKTFVQLQEPSLMGKVYNWAQFLYSTYGWTAIGYNVYVDPAMAKFVFSTACSSLSYVMVLLL